MDTNKWYRGHNTYSGIEQTYWIARTGYYANDWMAKAVIRIHGVGCEPLLIWTWENNQWKEENGRDISEQ